MAAFRRETGFLVERFDDKFVNTTNVNYPAAFCEAMALAGVVLKDDDKTALAKAMVRSRRKPHRTSSRSRWAVRVLRATSPPSRCATLARAPEAVQVATR